MLRLETLGGLVLIDGDGHPVVPQRRRLAVLALLASAGVRGMTRDKLIAILWPESTAAHARHALEQLLYSMRRQGLDRLVGGSDPLWLDPAVVQTDLAAVAQRLGAGDLAGAVRLYQGPFLDGFYLPDAPEFERWTEGERARLASEHAKALRTLAEQAETLGRQTTEIDWRRQLVTADPLAERAMAQLVRALAAAGDWAGASQAAREYAARAAEDLPGVVVTDFEALVERLRGEGGHAPAQAGEGEGGRSRYVVEREIGRGSVATVYLARDRRFDRQVALKLLRPELATATDARRFRREIALLAPLYHPHILQLFDSGILQGEGGGPTGLYYVMPYVRGETLAQRLEREPRLPIPDAVGIACDIAEALDYAHGEGVLHRDIRPDNILLESGQALVADFGIAGVLERSAGEGSSTSGVVLGVPRYASPEQARGERPLDARSDLYSLGCVLYEMLAGQPPFGGSTTAAILARQISAPARPLRTLRPEVPPGVEHAVGRALAELPEDRHASAKAFAAALRPA